MKDQQIVGHIHEIFPPIDLGSRDAFLASLEPNSGPPDRPRLDAKERLVPVPFPIPIGAPKPANRENGKYVRFMPIARAYAALSKLPGTKVGCLIVDRRFATLAEGWNGAPCGCGADVDERSAERETRLKWVVHAEANAIAAAARLGHSLVGSTLICTLMPCMTCAKLIVQAGITRVVCPKPGEENARWGEEFELATQLFKECHVALIHIDENGEQE